MFERDQLLSEFDEILRQRNQSFERLESMIGQVGDEAICGRLRELRDHTERHVELAERLMEIVD